MKFGYAIFYVDKVEETVQFYEKAFGLKRRFVHESGYAELETGETALAFCSHTLATSNGLAYNNQNPPACQISLVSSNVDQDFQHAVDNGAAVLVKPKTKPWGQTVAYLKDLNGFIVEICSPVGQE